MLFRLVVMLSVAALALALAACAETGGAIAASMAEQAAMIAATRATIATTEAIGELETASTQMSAQGGQANQLRGLPKLPPVGKGKMIIFTPDLMILQNNGVRLIVPRENYEKEEQQDGGAVNQ
jgi:hypothetical protein